MLALPMLGFAQTTHVVTFKVNTANITVGPNGLFLGGGIFGGSNAIQMTDADSNGVWEVTDTVDGVNQGNFIFFNSPTGAADWATKENLAGLPCGDAANYNDRIMPQFTQDTTLLFCFGTCDTACSSIGIEEEIADFVVKPNPASDVLFIENTTGTTTSVAVYNLLGAKVMEENFEANTRLDVATLPRGMYIVRVQNGLSESVVRISLK